MTENPLPTDTTSPSDSFHREVAEFITTLEGKSFEELDTIRIQLRGDTTTIDELPEIELEKMVAVCARLKQTPRIAAKPKANGAQRSRQPADLAALLMGMIKKN